MQREPQCLKWLESLQWVQHRSSSLSSYFSSACRGMVNCRTLSIDASVVYRHIVVPRLLSRPLVFTPDAEGLHQLRRLEHVTAKALKDGDPGWIRTSDPQLRRLMLYPAELRGRRRGFSRLGRRCKDAAQTMLTRVAASMQSGSCWEPWHPEKADSRRAEFNKKMKASEHLLRPANAGS